MDVLLRELCVEKSEKVIDETRVFACSYELFKLAASSCVCFVEYLTARFYGFITHSQFYHKFCSVQELNLTKFIEDFNTHNLF